MTILYCAVADKTLNSEKNTSPINGIRYLDPTNWHIENDGFSVSAQVSSLNKAIPQNQNILKVLADKLIATASTVHKRSAGKQAINPLLEFANIFCIDIPDDYYQLLSLRNNNDWLILDPSKITIVGVFRLSIIDYRYEVNKKEIEVLLNKSADKKPCDDFRILAGQVATALNKKLIVEQADFTIDGKLNVKNANTLSVKDLQQHMIFPPALPASASLDDKETKRLLDPPNDVQVSKDNRNCNCVLL